jgi:hypothetical protein
MKRHVQCLFPRAPGALQAAPAGAAGAQISNNKTLAPVRAAAGSCNRAARRFSLYKCYSASHLTELLPFLCWGASELTALGKKQRAQGANSGLAGSGAQSGSDGPNCWCERVNHTEWKWGLLCLRHALLLARRC